MKIIYSILEAEKELGTIKECEVKIEISTQELIDKVDIFKKEETKKWTERDGLIFLTVTSDGTTGKEWIKRLENKGFKIGTYAKKVLLSKDFKVTDNIKYELVIMKTNKYITSQEIRDNAKNLGFKTPNTEVACLIRELLSNEDIKELGFWYIVTFHKPIKDSVGDLVLLSTDRNGDGTWLNAGYGDSDGSWNGGSGVAFEVSQVSL